MIDDISSDAVTDVRLLLLSFYYCNLRNDDTFTSSRGEEIRAFAKCCISEILTAIKWEERRYGVSYVVSC